MSRSEEKLQKVATEISKSPHTCCYRSTALVLTFPSPLPPLHSFSLHTLTCPSEEKYGREVRVIAVDFSAGQDIYPQIAEELKDLDIGILGGSHSQMVARGNGSTTNTLDTTLQKHVCQADDLT